MIGAKMKDWDKQTSNNIDDNTSLDGGSDAVDSGDDDDDDNS